MTATQEAKHFRKLAADIRAEADASKLAQVKERCLRSAERYDQLAERAERVLTMRPALAMV